MKALLMALIGGSVAFSSAAAALQMSDDELLESLKGAAPAEVMADATVVKVTPDGGMETVREGTNGWTCLDPGGAPMCADAGGFEWVKAYMVKGDAPQKLGFIYMLKGDSGVSNTDPYGMTETPDNNWVVTGPHVMIVGAKAKNMVQAYPRAAKADPSKPFAMWPGTPYEHLMLPIE